jgi:hypothetical protein
LRGQSLSPASLRLVQLLEKLIAEPHERVSPPGPRSSSKLGGDEL